MLAYTKNTLVKYDALRECVMTENTGSVYDACTAPGRME